MGVRYLTTYIETRTHLLGQYHTFQAREDTAPIALVADGFALLHHVLTQCDIKWVQGCDLAAFADALKYVLSEWTKAGLQPIILWDGTSPDSKLATILSRTAQRARLLETLSRASGRLQESMMRARDDLLISPFLYDVATDLVDRLGYQQYFCLEEADTSCGGLAELLNGYVTSQDSDFFLMGMRTRGYIPMSSFSYPVTAERSDESASSPADGFKRVTHNSKPIFKPDNPQGLSAVLFPANVLAEYLHIEPETLPILASLLGNDFVPFDLTKDFRVDRKYSFSRSNQDHFEARLLTISRLLQEHGRALRDRTKFILALKKILSFLLQSTMESERTASVVAMVIASVEQYLLLCPTNALSQGSKSGSSYRETLLMLRTKRQLEDFKKAEPWVGHYLRGQLSFKALGLFQYQTFFFPLFVEDSDAVSAVTVTRGLVQKIVILSFEPRPGHEHTVASWLDEVQVYAKGRTVNMAPMEIDDSTLLLAAQIKALPLSQWTLEARRKCFGTIFDIDASATPPSVKIVSGVCALRFLIRTVSAQFQGWRFCKLELMAILAAFRVGAHAWQNSKAASMLLSSPGFPLSKRILHRVGQVSMATYITQILGDMLQARDFLPADSKAHQICQGTLLWHFLLILEKAHYESETKGLRAVQDLAATFLAGSGPSQASLFDAFTMTISGLEDQLLPSPFVARASKKSSVKKVGSGGPVNINLANQFDRLRVE